MEDALAAKRKAAAAEEAAAARVREKEEELEAAKNVHRDAEREHKNATARYDAAAAASAGVDRSPAKDKAVTPLKRARSSQGAQEPTLQGLPDACKASLEYKRAKAKAALHIFSVGDTVEGKYGGVKSQGVWFRGVISAVSNGGEDGVTYSIDYDDGDKEHCVLPKFVREPRSRAFAADGAAAVQAPQATKQPELPQAPPSQPSQPKPLPSVPKPRTASVPPPPAATPATSSAGDFRYDQPWHFSAARCIQNGCTLNHVKLEDFLPGAESQDRNKLRKAVRSGEIAGTNKVPQRDSAGKPKEPGRSTVRNTWWWHEGDPELTIAKRKFENDERFRG